MAGSAVPFACGSEEIRPKGVEADWGIGDELPTSWCPAECQCPVARASGRSGRWQQSPSAVSQRSGRVATGASSGLVGSFGQGIGVSCCWRLHWR